MPSLESRRGFIKTGVFAAGGVLANLHGGTRASAAGYRSAIDRPVCGYIGAGIRSIQLLPAGLRFGPCAAICDVDGVQMRNSRTVAEMIYLDAGVAPPPIELYEDYRRILDRSDIDAVVIATPDHWHVKIAVEAMHAGKDVYCEKPLTLTIAEGRVLNDAIAATGRILQVGTQQRSGEQFQKAVGLMRDGRLGKPVRLTCGINDSPSSEALPLAAPPAELNWNRWLGPAPWAPYRAAPTATNEGYGGHHPHGRGHAHFRWWYEYAGGKLTDWGAHHVDIAMWALGKSDGSIGRFTIDPIRCEHPVPMENGMPTLDDRFNTATNYHIRIAFEDGVELDIVDYSEDLKFGNGVMFQCERGRYFVNRGKLTGKPVEELSENPLPEDFLKGIYAGPSDAQSKNAHMRNFMDCLKSRETPISDAESHHRHLTVCHATNIALRLGRKLTFDTASERFIGDDRANEMIARESRKGFEIDV